MIFDDFNPIMLRSTFEWMSSRDARATLSQQCRKRVIAWKWSRGQMWRPEPYRYQWFGSRDRWLTWWEPRRTNDLRHGIDDQAMVHVAEQWCANGRRTNTSRAETYIVHRQNELETVRYRYPDHPEVDLIHRNEFRDSLLNRTLAIGRSFCSERRYVWSSGRLTNVLAVGWEHTFDNSQRTWQNLKANSWNCLTFHYSDRGQLSRIENQVMNEDGSPCTELRPTLIYSANIWERLGRRSLIQ